MFLDYDSLQAPPESGRRYFIFTDQIGTPCLVEDESGAEVWRAAIEPFGDAKIAPGTKMELNLRFPGHYFDPELGLHYNRFRYYDPRLGRYLQSDPWGIAGGYNLYAYGANPLLKADVRGLGEENQQKGRICEDEEGIVRPGDEEGVANAAATSGMEPETLAALQQRAQDQGELIIVRDSNPNSTKYQDTETYPPDEYTPKPLTCKLKTDPVEGLVMNTGENEGKDAPPGYSWDNEGYLRTGDKGEDGIGQKVYGDHDLQGVYVPSENEDQSYQMAPTNNKNWQADFNNDIGAPPTMVQHGANDDYWPNGKIGRQPDADESFTVIDPNGNVINIPTTAALQQFYDALGIPWPYKDFLSTCPNGK
jgi:RHS repeat-associated protein